MFFEPWTVAYFMRLDGREMPWLPQHIDIIKVDGTHDIRLLKEQFRDSLQEKSMGSMPLGLGPNQPRSAGPGLVPGTRLGQGWPRAAVGPDPAQMQWNPWMSLVESL